MQRASEVAALLSDASGLGAMFALLYSTVAVRTLASWGLDPSEAAVRTQKKEVRCQTFRPYPSF